MFTSVDQRVSACWDMVVIAISGLHGAGKTTVARSLVKKFGLRYVCAGTIFRKMAREHGMSLDEFSRYVEDHPEIDQQIDWRTAEASEEDDVVIDARLAGWMAKDADVKILLIAPLEARIRRIVRRESRRYGDVLEETRKRERSEADRFKKLYGIDIDDHSVFDLVLNTERLRANETAKILEGTVASVLKRRK